MNVINAINSYFWSTAASAYQSAYSSAQTIFTRTSENFPEKPAALPPAEVTTPETPFEPTDAQIDRALSSPQNFKKFADRIRLLGNVSGSHQKISTERQELATLAERTNVFLANIPAEFELISNVEPPNAEPLPTGEPSLITSFMNWIRSFFTEAPVEQPPQEPAIEQSELSAGKKKMLEQLQKMSQDLGIPLPEARKKWVDEASELLEGISRELAHLSTDEEKAASDQKRVEQLIRQCVETAVETPVKKSEYDEILSFHAGGDLLKGEGDFLFAEAPPHLRPELTVEKIQSLLQGQEAIRAGIKDGQIVPMAKGPILLYKISVAAAIRKEEQIDFGDNQRSGVLETFGRLGVIISEQDPKKTKSISPFRSAAIERAESILIMRAFTKLFLVGKTTDLDFNSYTRMASHLDALAANDLAKKGYCEEPRYHAYKSIFEHFIREPVKHAVVSQKVHSATQELLAEKGYKWSDDLSRISQLKELHDRVLVHFFANAGEFIQQAKADPFSQRRLSWFIEEFEKLQTSAKTLFNAMGRDLPCLRHGEAALQDPAYRIALRKQLRQFDENSAIALRHFLENLDHFYSQSINIAVASGSPLIAGKIKRYLQELNSWELMGNRLLPWMPSATQRKKKLAAVGEKLTNGYMKTLQDPPRVNLLTKDFFKGTPFNSSAISVLGSYKLQLKSGLQKEASRLQRIYKLQSQLGHDQAKEFFFPIR